MKDITTELRIGNWVTFDGNPLGVDVSDSPVKMDSKMFHAVINGFKGYDPVGIPLTEEWLVKFGATSKNYDYELGYIKYDREASDYGCECEKSNFWIVPNGDDDYYRIPIKLECVHQLQNLYFSLTGEELTLK